MCMLIRWSGLIPRKAVIERTVYKVMKVYDDGRIVSMYRNHQYNLGELNETFLTFSKRSRMSRTVHQGLHAYVHYDDALSEQQRAELADLCSRSRLPLLEPRDFKYEIFECTIPRGAKFYRGVWDVAKFYLRKNIANIVSNQLIITEQVKD